MIIPKHRVTCTILFLFLHLFSAAAASSETGIIWVNFLHTKALGNTLVRSQECAGCLSGALSQQQILSGDGFVKFNIHDVNNFQNVGLANPNTLASPPDIDFGLTIQNGVAEIREKGGYLMDVAVANDDEFSISIESGLIHYYHNGTRIYTSAAEPVYPLLVVALLGNDLAEVSNALISSSSGILWKDMKNVQVAGLTLMKSEDCDTCADAAASSSQVIESGDGSIEFTVTSLSSLYVALHSAEAGTTSQQNQFGITVSDGIARPSHFSVSHQAVPAEIGDVFRIAIENGRVVYYRNEVFFAATQSELHYPYTFRAALTGDGSSLANARMTGSNRFDAGGGSDPDSNWNRVPNCGLNTGSRYVPVDYDAPPPARQSTFIDPIFGCPITRLSDGMAQYNVNVRHQYSSISPFNSDNSMILLEAGDGRGYIVDVHGNVVVTREELGIATGAEPIWDIEAPNIIYYHPYQDNRIMVYDVFAKARMTLYTFSQYDSISFGGGEGDISEDGNHIIIVGDNRYAHVFEGTTRKVSKALDTAGRGFDWIDMTPDNNVLVMWHAIGSGRFRGLELYDRELNFIRQVLPFVGHADRGRDVNGDEIVVIMSGNDLDPLPECAGSGVIKVRLSDSKKTCLMRLTWGQSGHISLNNTGGHPWALVSNTEYFSGGSDAASELSPDWADGWAPHYNELTLVKLDGSQIIRLAHHRSRVQDAYIHMPRASISRDGRYVLFDSNFAQQPVQEYTDVYLIDTAR